MKPYVQDADFTLFNGDAVEVLRELPEASVHCCVTSPPFYGLRDYGVEGQIGLEPTPEEWVARLVDVFREVRRVLRADGTLWIECGDSYDHGTRVDRQTRSTPSKNHGYWNNEVIRTRVSGGNTKPKDLMGTPWLLAFALRDDGWWLRQANIWWHTNCLPESAKDRPTSAHSYIFLFSPSARYFYDQVAVQEPAAWDRWGAQTNKKDYGLDGTAGAHKIKERSKAEVQALAGRGPDNWNVNQVGLPGESENRGSPAGSDIAERGTRNLRSVWPIPTEGLSEAHFATMPQAVVRPCILAGTSERGCCPECGAPWVREIETSYVKSPKHGAGSIVGSRNGERDDTHLSGGKAEKEGIGEKPRVNRQDTTTGWSSFCECVGSDDVFLPPVPAVVLDPFLGSGTTALVARKHGKSCIGIELSPDYCALAARRLSQQSLLTEATA